MPDDQAAALSLDDSSVMRQSSQISTATDGNEPKSLKRVKYTSDSRIDFSKGKFLNSRSSKLEAGSSCIARSGFQFLATSEQFVKIAKAEVEKLLDEFCQEWQKEVTRSQQISYQLNKFIERPSLFAVFKRLYKDQGWHFHQLYWSEHQETRDKIYQTFIRSLTDRLRIFLPLISLKEDSQIIYEAERLKNLLSIDVLKACGVLFGLKCMRATTVLIPSDVNLKSASGRIAIEADLLHVLLLLPEFIRLTSILPSWPEQTSVQPIEEIVFTLRELMGESDQIIKVPSDGADLISKHFVASIDILAPTSFEARMASTNNKQATRTEIERKSGQWGTLVSKLDQMDNVHLSRADVMYNQLRQRLDLPLQVPTRHGIQESGFILESKKVKRSAGINLPDGITSKMMLERLQEVRNQKETYEGRKREALPLLNLSNLLPSRSDVISPAQTFNTQMISLEASTDADDMLQFAKKSVIVELRESLKRAARS